MFFLLVRISIHDLVVFIYLFIYFFNILHVLSQFMVAFLNGRAGLAVAGHAQEELNVVLARVPIPRLKTEEETVTTKGVLQN